MNKAVIKSIYWSPRVLCILSTLFLMIFSLDVFNEYHGFGPIALGLLMHNLPSLVLFGVLVLAWRWEWIGAVVFPSAGAFYIMIAWGNYPFSTYLLISGPFFLVGILFLLNWIYRMEIRGGNTGRSTGYSLNQGTVNQ